MKPLRVESLRESQLLLVGAQAVQLGLGLALTVVLLRRLDDEGFGLVVLAGSLIALGTRIVDAGLSAAVVTELARGDGAGRAVFRGTLAFRRWAAVAAAVVLGGAILGARPDDGEAVVLAFAVAIAIGASPLRTWGASFAASRRYRVAAAIATTAQLFFALQALSLLAVDPARAALLIAVAVAIREVVVSVAQWALGGPAPSPGPDLGLATTPPVRLWPLSVATVCGALYFGVDVLMIEILCDGREVGAYGAALRLVVPAITAVGLLAAPLSPFFATLAARPTGVTSDRVARGGATVLGAVAPVAVWFLLGDEIITWLADRPVAGAGEALRWLALTPVAIAVGSVASLALIATRRYGTWCIVSAVGAVGNLVLNALWIPGEGAVGAARATLATETTVALLAASTLAGPVSLATWRALGLAALPATVGAVVFAVVGFRGRPAVAVGAVLAMAAAIHGLGVGRDGRHRLESEGGS